MPADYSRDKLGWRVLDLLDDMNNWGEHKHVHGEVDIFKVEPHYEFYGHANINYIKLNKLPRFSDGWLSIGHSPRSGEFFTTTTCLVPPKKNFCSAADHEWLDKRRSHY